MIKLDTKNLENKNAALMECACYIFNCFSEEMQGTIKEDWEKAGGVKIVSWYKWVLDHCSVSYDGV